MYNAFKLQLQSLANIATIEKNSCGKFSYDEFRQEAIKRGIIADPNDSAISNAIFALKDNTRFETVDKGRYIIYKSDKGEKGMSVECSIDFIIKRLRKIKKMSVLDAANEDISRLAQEIESYKSLKKELDETFN